MVLIKGKAYENLTYYELDKKGNFNNHVEELANDIGEILITVKGVIDLDKEDQILPQEIIDATNEYPHLFRFMAFVVGSAITDPEDFNGKAIRAYKTKDNAQALLLAQLVSGWLGGSYIVVETHNRHEQRKPVYYVYSEGRRHYIEPGKKKNERWSKITRGIGKI